MTTLFPSSAISSWGGFVYQGKVALYHSIKILREGTHKGSTVSSFELQLDSTDDFAIYVGGKALSVHQVKGKCSEYRSSFETALSKSAKVSFDCTAATVRYFHIANGINDSSDYISQSGESVEFYDYDGTRYCPLDEIEDKTKRQIELYLLAKSLPVTPTLLESKYTALDALIARQVIKCHALIHTAGLSQNQVAYTERIPSDLIQKLLETDFHNLPDDEYRCYQVKKVFSDTFEASIASGLSQYSLPQIELFERIFRYIYGLDVINLRPLVDSFLPTEKYGTLRKGDVEIYAEIVTTITQEVVLKGLPHFKKTQQRYLPTAINIRPRQLNTFADELIKHIRSNEVLANVLFEYNILIGFCDGVEVKASSDKITNVKSNTASKINNIVQEFQVSVVSLPKAIEELNA